MSPFLSISLRTLASGQTRAQEQLRRACIEHGFFLLHEHGVDPTLIEATLAASRRFFELPLATKQRYGHAAQVVKPASSRGYIPLHGEILHPHRGPDAKESFDLGLERSPSTEEFTGPTTLPDERTAPDFARAHFALQDAVMRRVVPPLVRALGWLLGDSELEAAFEDPVLIQRVTCYPPRRGGAGKHTDTGMFTLLLQEQLAAPSLRVCTGGAWVPVPCVPNTFVVNLGDMLQHWSAGNFVSTPHEVVHELPVSRLSVAFFVYPTIDIVFTPLNSAGSSTRAPVSVRDVMLQNYRSIWTTKSGAGRASELAET